MKLDNDVTYQTVNLFSSDKCFICFISDCPHYIRWNLITILKYEHIIAPHVSSTSIFTRIVQTVLCWFRNQHNTVCTTLVKIDVLDTYGAMICSYFGIIFLLLFKKIENAVYTSFKNSILLFINGLIFDIMNIQNNQSLEFERIPMLAPLIDLSMIKGFHVFVMFSWSLSKIGWILFSNAKETLQKILARKCSYRGKHMKE